ncbi:MAG: extracellular solute-binding protein, partial [Bacilli bacterium]|nr:extracellular solute-binding protein [Bacilli bacterium]
KESYLNFKTDQAKANLTYLKENYQGNQNLIIPGSTGGTTDIEGLSYFLSGQAEAIIVAPYFWASAKEEFGDKVAMASLPRLNSQDLRPFSGYKLYGVSRYSKEPALAQALADFLISEWAQALRFKEKSLLPTQLSLSEKLNQTSITIESWRKLEATKIVIPEQVLLEGRVFKESLNKSYTMPKLSRFSAFWHAYSNNIKAYWEADNVSDEKLNEYLDNITKNM